VAFGASRPGLRQRGTLATLTALTEEALLSPEEHEHLRDAYVFLRDVENKLQMANDIQVHALPDAPADLAVLAARLGYPKAPRALGVDAFLEDYRRHTQVVNQLFLELFDERDGRHILTRPTE
jgi:[glutamine synthetase] adenylyltransferase / [glutamine synthetase]-adenylyl-L-tyrosine phosphorylase